MAPSPSSTPIPGRSSSPAPSSSTTRQATLRLGSPVIGHAFPGTSPPRSTPAVSAQNALSALNYPGSSGSPPRFGTPPRYSTPPRTATPSRYDGPAQGMSTAIPGPSRAEASSLHNYGSFDSRQAPFEDVDVVRRHLVTEEERAANDSSSGHSGGGEEEFSSLQLQGGDITRGIYRYVEGGARGARERSRSFHLPRPDPEHDTEDFSSINAVGGFRRDFIRRQQARYGGGPYANGQRPSFFTRNFIEFLTLHGHFAGEDLEEEEEEEEEESRDGLLWAEEGIADREGEEDEALLGESGHSRPRRQSITQGTAGSGKAVLLLLKSFVGTGVLFLPKAYSNGGMMFCNLVLLFVALLSYYCFVLLVRTRLKIVGSFGDIGGILYGPRMRWLILMSIVVSQIGFAAAYIVFTSENLQAFILAVSNNKTHIDIRYLILLQLVVFTPLAMIRDMAKLGGTALVADFFIMLGLVYLYYYDIFTLSVHGVSDIVQFNHKNWTLFIGTAIFTFEGIGLIIPIQESMKKPEKFPKILGWVMVLITAIFLSMGALSYAAYGSATRTVVILNLPQDNRFVNGVQFLYSLAILLSTPLQLFPAIRIMETGLFPRHRSGKHHRSVKWQKNAFRFGVVIATAMVSWGGADDLDKFVALIGSFACIPLVYIYPPLLHMRAYPGGWFRKWSDIGLCVFGLAVMTYTTALTIWQWGGTV